MKRLGKKERAAKAALKAERQLRIRMARATVERWQDAGIVSIAAGRMRTKRVGTSPLLTRSQVDIIAKVEAAKDAARKGVKKPQGRPMMFLGEEDATGMHERRLRYRSLEKRTFYST